MLEKNKTMLSYQQLTNHHKNLREYTANERNSFPQRLNPLAKDELREAEFCQRVRQLENTLFDEYWEELLAYRKQIGATR